MTDVIGFYVADTPPDGLIVSLVDMKGFLKVDTTADDALITAMIKGATISAQKYMNRILEDQPFTVQYPCSEAGAFNEIERAPLNSITSVKFWDSDTDAYVATTDFILRPSHSYGRLFYDDGFVEPVTDNAFAIEIVFQAGYATGSVPTPILEGVKQHVAFLYENRGDVQSIGDQDIPTAAKLFYRQYRILTVF